MYGHGGIKKDVLKNRFISNFFMLVHLDPQFTVWNVVQSLKLYSQKQFLSIIANLSTELNFSTVNWAADSEGIRLVYSTAILSNRATIREGNSTEIDSVFT